MWQTQNFHTLPPLESVMQHCKVKSVKAVDDHTLLVEFDNAQTKRYDVAPLLKRSMLAPLKSLEIFNAVRVDQGGYAVVWTDNIDISENELWQHGQLV
jgi:hypothetical protein